MTIDDELRVLRARVAGLEEELARRTGGVINGTPAQVVEHRRGSGFVDAAGRFFLGRAVRIEGEESENATASVVGIGGNDWVVRVLGSTPQIGDLLIARNVAHRWHAWRETPDGGCDDCINVPGCPCQQVPPRLRMTSSHPASNGGILRDAILIYRDLPVGLQPLGLADRGFLSETQYVDLATGDLFYYYLSCFQNNYLLTRLYETSFYSSPFRDSTRYTWAMTDPDNSCDPFELMDGTIFAGADPVCVVTIVADPP